MITGIGHVAFRCSDLGAALEFYCGKLGFTKMFTLPGPDGKVWIQYIGVTHQQYIELFPDDGAIERPDTAAYRHLALHTDDLAADVERLRAAGVTIDIEPKRGDDGNLQAWISDPDGNHIELMQLMPGSLQKEADPD